MPDKKVVLTGEKIKRNMLDEKAVLIRLKIQNNLFDKKAYLAGFFIINSNNQELIHHIHCFGCIFCHQSKTKKFWRFRKFLFYDVYFEP